MHLRGHPMVRDVLRIVKLQHRYQLDFRRQTVERHRSGRGLDATEVTVFLWRAGQSAATVATAPFVI